MKKMSLTALCLLVPALAGAADGTKLYQQYCLKCHGATGAGDGKAAKLFDPKPTNFTESTWGAKVTDEQIFDAIKNGNKATKLKVGKKMAAFDKKMNDGDIQAVVKVVRGLASGKK